MKRCIMCHRLVLSVSDNGLCQACYSNEKSLQKTKELTQPEDCQRAHKQFADSIQTCIRNGDFTHAYKLLEDAERLNCKDPKTMPADLLEELYLRLLLTVYKSLEGNEKVNKAIDETELSKKINIYYGEFAYIPLQNSYGLKWYEQKLPNKSIVEKVSRELQVYDFIILDRIVRNCKSREGFYDLADLWGNIKKGDLFSDYCLVLSEEDRHEARRLYSELMYLYRSLITANCIIDSGQITQEAFMLCIWVNAYQEILQNYQLYTDMYIRTGCFRYSYCSETSLEYIDQNTSNSQGHAISDSELIDILYEVIKEEPSTIKYYLASLQYTRDKSMTWRDTYIHASQMVNSCIEKHKQIQYINRLLHNDNNEELATIEFADTLNPNDFERLIMLVFRKMGYNAQTTKASGDQGVDVVAEQKDVRIAIQVKCYSNPVGNTAIQEVVAGKSFYNANLACVVTNSSFTKSAIELAKANNVILWDRNKLKNLLVDCCIPISRIL